MLSIGCGAAGKERALARMLPDRSFVGIDIAAKTLDRVRGECADAGLMNLELKEGDAVGPLVVESIKPGGVFFAHDGVSVLHKVGR